MWSTSDRASRLPPDWEARRTAVLSRDRRLCQLRLLGCKRVATEVDHIDPGDNHSYDNLRAVCTRCHARKSAGEGVRARAALRAARKRPAERHPGRVSP